MIVVVVAREPPLETTSAVAGAVWFPYLVAPEDRCEQWGARTYEVLAELAASAPESGVVMRELLVSGREPLPELAWHGALRGFRRARPDELPADHVDGWLASVPVVETPRYLPWLAARLTSLGGSLEIVPAGVESLAAAGRGGALVVHCSGLGARALAGDETMVAVRGQVVLVDNPGVARVVVVEDDPAGPTYVIPRRDDCVVGGTAETGEEGLVPDRATTEAILARATRLVPALAGARLRKVRVGLRPVRPEVRLELERSTARPPVDHCYGHGGAGFTLAWGCADEVVRLAAAVG